MQRKPSCSPHPQATHRPVTRKSEAAREPALAAPEAAGSSRQLAGIARTAIKLAELGPRLAGLAAEMNEQAKSQAAVAAATAATMQQLSRALERGVEELRGSSNAVDSALATVTRIAEQTKLLSINASIEAARSAGQGHAFSAVATEIQRLASDTASTTHAIEERMHEMRLSVGRVEAVGGTPQADGENLGAANRQMQQLSASAARQLESARDINGCGREVNDAAEALLLLIGTFRFGAHARAEQAVAELLPSLEKTMGQRVPLEAALVHWLQAHEYFELVYVTDAHGRQFIDNIGRAEGKVVHDPAGYGRDWSDRPWYREARSGAGVRSTDIYRSAATRDFCFTVSAAVSDAEGKITGVIGADVNFHRLLQQ